MKKFYIFSITLLLFFVFSFLFKSDSSFDQDLGRHLKLGEIIWQTKNIPTTNLFSYTYPDFPFVNHHYLFEVFSYLLSTYLGLQSLLILKVLSLMLTVFIVFKTIDKKYSLTLLPLGYLFTHVLRGRTDYRPEIFSFVFTVLIIYNLEKFLKTKSKLIYLIPLIQLFWSNIHIYFPLGWFIQAVFLAQVLFKKEYRQFRTLGFIFISSILASSINPQGIKALFYPFQIFGNYGYSIVENQSIFFLENIGFKNADFLFVKLCALLVIISLIVGFFRKTANLKTLGLSVMGLVLALLNMRSFPYLFLISLPAVLEQFGVVKFKYLIWFNSLLVFLILFESLYYFSGEYYKYANPNAQVGLYFTEHGKKGMDFVLTNNLKEPIYNNFDIGSYLIYRGYNRIDPESGSGLGVFVDGRPESYPKEFFQQVYIPSQENFEKFTKLADEKNIQTVIFSIVDQTPWAMHFFQTITHSDKWKVVFIDDFLIVWVRNNQSNEILPSINLEVLTPEKYQFEDGFSYLKMVMFLFNNGFITAAEKFNLKALEILPDEPRANLLAAQIIQIKKDNLSIPLIKKYLEKSTNPVFW